MGSGEGGPPPAQAPAAAGGENRMLSLTNAMILQKKEGYFATLSADEQLGHLAEVTVVETKLMDRFGEDAMKLWRQRFSTYHLGMLWQAARMLVEYEDAKKEVEGAANKATRMVTLFQCAVEQIEKKARAGEIDLGMHPRKLQQMVPGMGKRTDNQWLQLREPHLGNKGDLETLEVIAPAIPLKKALLELLRQWPLDDR